MAGPCRLRPFVCRNGTVRSLTVAFLVALMAPTVSAATFVTIDEQLAPCLGCHGENGQSKMPEVPSLGAQPEFYLSVQLYMFRERLRNVEPMIIGPGHDPGQSFPRRLRLEGFTASEYAHHGREP